jgi:hypothetical protein
MVFSFFFFLFFHSLFSHDGGMLFWTGFVVFSKGLYKVHGITRHFGSGILWKIVFFFVGKSTMNGCIGVKNSSNSSFFLYIYEIKTVL